MPTVRSIDPDTPNRVELPLMVPYDVVQLTAIQESFPELRKQLASKWPVKGIWRVLKNALPAHYPAFHLSELEIRIAFEPADTLAKAAANQLVSEAYIRLQIHSQLKKVSAPIQRADQSA